MLNQLLQRQTLAGSQWHANTMQLPVRLQIGGKQINKARFYVIEAKAFRSLARAQA
jgi:hypothetical protein